jgi:hypothetical protein
LGAGRSSKRRWLKFFFYGEADALPLAIRKVRGIQEWEIVHQSGDTFDAGFCTRFDDRDVAKAVVHMLDHAFRIGKKAERRRIVEKLGLET